MEFQLLTSENDALPRLSVPYSNRSIEGTTHNLLKLELED